MAVRSVKFAFAALALVIAACGSDSAPADAGKDAASADASADAGCAGVSVEAETKVPRPPQVASSTLVVGESPGGEI